jgi:hypothetical protein
MSENIENKVEPLLATLSEGEPLISKEQSENFKDIIEEIKKEDVKEAVEEKATEPVLAEEENANNIISSEIVDKPSKPKKPALAPVANGVVGSSNANKPDKVAAVVDEKPTVAIHSTRNVSWNGVGKVSAGYNIVTKSAADKWLTRGHIRLATPEEVAKEYNK